MIPIIVPPKKNDSSPLVFLCDRRFWSWYTVIEVIESESSARVGRHGEKESGMNKDPEKEPATRSEYDFAEGVRGKYADQYAQGTNIILLDPDLCDVFTDSRSVNQALRAIADILRDRENTA